MMRKRQDVYMYAFEHASIWVSKKKKKNQLSKIDCYLNINLQFFYNRH